VTFFVTFNSSYLYGNTIKKCIEDVCKKAVDVENVSSFLNREKTEHKDFSTTISKYQEQFDSYRLARKEYMAEAIEFFKDKEGLNKSIQSLSEIDLLKLLFELQAWNTEVEIINGEFEMVFVPRTGISAESDVVKKIIAQLFKISPLYHANLKVIETKLKPFEALDVPENTNLKNHITRLIKKRIEALPEKYKPEYETAVTLFTQRLEAYFKQPESRAYLLLGDFDAEMAILQGKVQLSNENIAVLRSMIIRMFTQTIENHENGIQNFETIYSKDHFNKMCKEAINRSLHYGLSKAEVQTFEIEQNKVVSQSKDAVHSIFGPLAVKINEYIDTMSIGGPISIDDYFERMQLTMTHSLDRMKTSKRNLIYFKGIISNLGNDSDGIFDTICNSWIYEPLRDSVNPGNIILSAYSAENVSVGIGIIAHEIGHTISMALDILKHEVESIYPFEEIRSCLSENYKNSKKMNVTYDHSKYLADKLWTEEDWADAFTGFVLKGSHINSSCEMAGIRQKHDFATMSERDNDTHSPTFYRILNLNIHLGHSTPKTCEKPLNEKYEGIKFEDCLTKYSDINK